MRCPVMLLCCAAGLIAPRLAAQDNPPILTGVVVDEAGNPLDGAEVFLDRSSKPVTTDARGRFRIDPAPRGPHWVAVRRIGYKPERRALTLEKGESQTLTLTLTALPVTLPEIQVTEMSGMKVRRLNDFFRRSRTGFGGRFITRDDIERRRPYALSQLLRSYLPFAALTPAEYPSNFYLDLQGSAFGGASGFQSQAFGRGYRTRCPPAISFNGAMPGFLWYVDDLPVSEVEAVEIYRPGWAEMPIEYTAGLTGAQARRCGLVIVWQR